MASLIPETKTLYWVFLILQASRQAIVCSWLSRHFSPRARTQVDGTIWIEKRNRQTFSSLGSGHDPSGGDCSESDLGAHYLMWAGAVSTGQVKIPPRPGGWLQMTVRWFVSFPHVAWRRSTRPLEVFLSLAWREPEVRRWRRHPIAVQLHQHLPPLPLICNQATLQQIRLHHQSPQQRPDPVPPLLVKPPW